MLQQSGLHDSLDDYREEEQNEVRELHAEVRAPACRMLRHAHRRHLLKGPSPQRDEVLHAPGQHPCV